jgi:tetratricopeptide (TPR) repeat protein
MPQVPLTQPREIFIDNSHSPDSSNPWRRLQQHHLSQWMRMCALALVLPAVALPTAAAVQAPNGTDTDALNLAPEVQVAYQHFYDLDYATAQTLFEKIAAEHPDDPMAIDYVLNNAVFRELYRLDLLDTTLYVEDGFLSGKHPVTENVHATRQIQALYQHAVDLSNRRLAVNPNDADALFARGFATSLETIYIGMVEKKYIAALHMASASRKDDDAVLKLDLKYVDCYLIVGVHEYVLGGLTLPLKVLAGLVGIHGSKSKGIKDLERVGRDGIINSVAARTSLAIFLRREAQYPKALEVIDGLASQYPHNFLFALEHANLLKDSGQGMRAIAAYQALLQRSTAPGGYYPDPHLEMAFYGLGEAARGQRHFGDAAVAYESATTQPTASPLMKRRAHLAAGEMFDLLGQRTEAKKKYDAVLALGTDSDQAERATKYEVSPYRGK